MQTRLELDLPTPDEIAQGLETITVYPGLEVDEKALATAEAALTDARRDLETAAATEAEMPARVHAGKASRADLEAAISGHRAAAALLPFHERDVEAAKAALVEAKRQARAAVVEEARRRRDGLQAVIDEQLAPVLDHLRELELRLVDALQEHAPEPVGDPVERSQALKLAPPVAGLRWPVSLAGSRRMSAGVPAGVVRPADWHWV